MNTKLAQETMMRLAMQFQQYKHQPNWTVLGNIVSKYVVKMDGASSTQIADLVLSEYRGNAGSSDI